MQVADRWHLTKNLGDTLHQVVTRHTKELRAATTDCHPPPTVVDAIHSAPSIPPPAGHFVGPRDLREFQFREIKRLRAESWSYRRIARTLHLHRRTVLRYAQAEELPRRILPQSTSSVTPYLHVVHDCWQRGDCTGPALLHAVQQQGYRGSLSSIYGALKLLRSGDGRRQQPTEAPRPAVPSPRQTMWLLVRAREDLSDDEHAFCAELCARSATIARAQQLAQHFLQMVRERAAEQLAPWLADARASGIAEFVSFANGLKRDHAAVYAALATEWSNAATEGNINRLKLIRRSMYGRGSFELLRRRVLHAS